MGSIFLNRGHKSDVHCPKCDAEAQRSRRHGFEKAIMFLRAYRCGKCRTRFRRFSYS
jgi:ssDNA-binding Zn-finger/Zn-ribbon topoisomerase 1